MSNEETHEFTEDDIASVVQQAMEGLVESQLGPDDQQAQNQNNDVDEFEQEIQRQLEAQLQEHGTGNHGNDQVGVEVQSTIDAVGETVDSTTAIETTAQPATQEASNGSNNIKEEDDDFAKEIERQLQQQMEEEMAKHAMEQSEPVEDNTRVDAPAMAIDYEQELTRQIMDALDDNGNTSTDQQDVDQILQAINATDAVVEESKQFHTDSTAQSVQFNAPHSAPQLKKNIQTQQDQTVTQPEEVNYEAQLHKQIMDAFAATEDSQSSQVNVSGAQEKQASNQDGLGADLEQELHNQILQAFNESKTVTSQNSQENGAIEEDPYKDALAELVRNVVETQVDASDKAQEQQGVHVTSVDEEDIDMNQIMQNALALAVEDPNTLLQNLNISEDFDSAFLGQMLQQSEEQTKGSKNKTTKTKEKKSQKEKKPRQPRKATKKKKNQPVVSQIPNFVPNPQFSITGIPFPQNLQHLPQSLQVQFQQQIQQQQQQMLLLQQQQHQQQQLLLQQQKHQQQKHPLQSNQPTSSSKQPSQQAVSTSNSIDVSGKSAANVLVPEPKFPKPAPANSILDSVKKVPPLVLLSKDTSIDLANSTKQKKTSLSIAETLALSRQSMSSGKFSSKLNAKSQEESQQKLASEQSPSQEVSGSILRSPSSQVGSAQPSTNNQYVAQLSQPATYPQVSGHQDQEGLYRQVGYDFENSDQGDKHTLESALTLASEILAKDSLDSGSSSKANSGVSSPQLPVTPGAQGTLLLNNIGSLLPNLPSHLQSLISSAISQALANTAQQPQRRENTKPFKKKSLPAKDETPEQQKERIRLENRERKKRWRDANRLKNQNNDLRARLKKRAIHLFGAEDSQKKLDWIEAEFEKRKNRRIIRSAKLEDLTAAISDTLNKLDIHNVDEETLSGVVKQIVSNSLGKPKSRTNGEQKQQQQQQQQQHRDDIDSLDNAVIESLAGFNKTSELEDAKILDHELSKLISASSGGELQESHLQTLDVHDFESQVDAQSMVAQKEQQLVSAVSQNTPKVIPQKRTSDVLTGFNVNKAKLKLIRMPGFDSKDRKKDVKDNATVVDDEDGDDGNDNDKSNDGGSQTKLVESMKTLAVPVAKSITVTPATTTTKEASSKPSTTTTVLPSRPTPKAKAPSPPNNPRSTIKIPTFKKEAPASTQASSKPPSASSSPSSTSVSTSVIKKEKLLMRPKFGGGLRKPSTFTNGLRKPGLTAAAGDKKVGA